MKKFLSILGLALLCASVKAQTPTYAPQSLGVFTCAAATATNLGYVISCGKQANVAIQVASTNVLDLTGTGNTLYYYQRSLEGVYYETNLSVFAVPGQGKNPATVVTNIPTQGAGFIRIAYATNAFGSATNLGWGQMWYGVKISAP